MSTLTISNLNDGTTTVPTTFVTNGSTKAWVTKNSGGTSIEDSFNVSSITDVSNATVDYTFINSMSNDDYSFATGVRNDGLRFFTTPLTNITTSSLRIRSYNNSGTLSDRESGTQIHGDLA